MERRKRVQGFIVVAVVGLGVLVWWKAIGREQAEQRCIAMAFGVNAPPEQIERGAAAVETGTLEVDGTEKEWAQNLHYLVRDGKLVADLAECRRIRVGSDSAGELIVLSGTIHVGVTGRGWRGPGDFGTRGEKGTLVSSTNPKVGTCVTDEEGSCQLPFHGLAPSERVVIKTDLPDAKAFVEYRGRATSVDLSALSFVADGANFSTIQPLN